MNYMEVILLVFGIVVFVVSFLLPEKKSDKSDSIDMDAFNALMDKEMQEAKNKVHEIVDETVEYAVEKTERASERISNEKIMAIDEYSQTVLADVNKAHQEVMFLYDMLNDKQKNIKETVKEVQVKTEKIEERAKEASKAADEAKENALEAKNHTTKLLEEQMFSTTLIPTLKDKKKVEVFSFAKESPKYERKQVNAETTFTPLDTNSVKEVTPQTQARIMENIVTPILEKETILADEESKSTENNNDKILRLSKEGMSNVDIAKKLGLGVGEVKLVLNLFKGAV